MAKKSIKDIKYMFKKAIVRTPGKNVIDGLAAAKLSLPNVGIPIACDGADGIYHQASRIGNKLASLPKPASDIERRAE